MVNSEAPNTPKSTSSKALALTPLGELTAGGDARTPSPLSAAFGPRVSALWALLETVRVNAYHFNHCRTVSHRIMATDRLITRYPENERCDER